MESAVGGGEGSSVRWGGVHAFAYAGLLGGGVGVEGVECGHSSVVFLDAVWLVGGMGLGLDSGSEGGCSIGKEGLAFEMAWGMDDMGFVSMNVS